MGVKRSSGPRRAGRPPAGRHGQCVRDYAQVSIRLPKETLAMLAALTTITGKTRWRVVEESLKCRLRDLPPRDRRLAQNLLLRLLDGAV